MSKTSRRLYRQRMNAWKKLQASYKHKVDVDSNTIDSYINKTIEYYCHHNVDRGCSSVVNIHTKRGYLKQLNRTMSPYWNMPKTFRSIFNKATGTRCVKRWHYANANNYNFSILSPLERINENNACAALTKEYA